LLALSGAAQSGGFGQQVVDDFIGEMVKRHGFKRTDLAPLMEAATPLPKVLASMRRPAEKKPWHQYRAIFLTPERTRAGIDFWVQHRSILEKVEQDYGVSPEVILAILGVETFYNRKTGDYRVLDALSTLAFQYPPRAAFFRSELEQFLLLTREQRLPPLSLKGSYAGAVGMPQFIPSSYRGYAVDFEGDGRADLWGSKGDVIASVANYFKRHGWATGEPVTVRARAGKDGFQRFVTEKLEPPRIPLDQLIKSGVVPEKNIDGNPLTSLVALDAEHGKEYWICLNNFYVITRYNHSPLYAMAVYQLAEAIRDGYKNQKVAGSHPAP
jgi:membrane-bound lytic murein transglycosylase B